MKEFKVFIFILMVICGPVFSVFVAARTMDNMKESEKDEAVTVDKFEVVRTYIQAWLSELDIEKAIMSSSYLKEKILDDWDNQSKKYQIVSVRKPDDYNNAGHIPHAKNIYWENIVTDENLARLDFSKTLIFYCYYGHGSMISYTILSLFGYRCCSLNFGMMDWNLDALIKKPWDKEADYKVEASEKRSIESFLPPVIPKSYMDIKRIIKEQAKKYLAGEGSPVMRSSDVKVIVDDWDHKKFEYQVIDVRSKGDYENGHVPHSMNIPWAKIVENKNLKKIDPNSTAIVYSENGQTGQMAATVLSLLGYKTVNMLFGIMDWNKTHVDKSDQWDGAADYPVEYNKDSLPRIPNPR